MRTLLIGVLLGFLAVAAPAGAQPGGPNGQIVFARFDPLLDDTTIYTVNPDGSHARQVLTLPAACPRVVPRRDQDPHLRLPAPRRNGDHRSRRRELSRAADAGSRAVHRLSADDARRRAAHM